MFTGIIEAIGSICWRTADTITISIALDAIAVGDSVAVNGVCLTLVEKKGGVLRFDVMEESVRRTALETLKAWDKINLEDPVKAGSGLGGHFVLGHVDCAAVVQEVRELGASREIWIAFLGAFSPFIVSAGSITIDGISLTVAKLEAQLFAVAVIPFTFAHTTINELKAGSRVNLEFDILGKYVARQLGITSSLESAKSKIDEEWLREQGF